jgi:hypothetical protein
VNAGLEAPAEGRLLAAPTAAGVGTLPSARSLARNLAQRPQNSLRRKRHGGDVDAERT